MKLVGIGFGNMVNAERIIAVVSPDSNPVKRMIATGKDNGMRIDGGDSFDQLVVTVILMDSDHIVLSYLSVESLETKIGQEELE